MFLTYSLASQPLLTLKAREVLVNEHTAVCPRSDIKLPMRVKHRVVWPIIVHTMHKIHAHFHFELIKTYYIIYVDCLLSLPVCKHDKSPLAAVILLS